MRQNLKVTKSWVVVGRKLAGAGETFAQDEFGLHRKHSSPTHANADFLDEFLPRVTGLLKILLARCTLSTVTRDLASPRQQVVVIQRDDLLDLR